MAGVCGQVRPAGNVGQICHVDEAQFRVEPRGPRIGGKNVEIDPLRLCGASGGLDPAEQRGACAGPSQRRKQRNIDDPPDLAGTIEVKPPDRSTAAGNDEEVGIGKHADKMTMLRCKLLVQENSLCRIGPRHMSEFVGTGSSVEIAQEGDVVILRGTYSQIRPRQATTWQAGLRQAGTGRYRCWKRRKALRQLNAGKTPSSAIA